ncbi:hypothetical protein Lal_00039316 [Lupinus albus]|nr:hypothetical protein Lal_00039316 [Lupinus albus]
MLVIREGIMVKCSIEILKVMYDIASSSSRLLSYGIFISRVSGNSVYVFAINKEKKTYTAKNSNIQHKAFGAAGLINLADLYLCLLNAVLHVFDDLMVAKDSNIQHKAFGVADHINLADLYLVIFGTKDILGITSGGCVQNDSVHSVAFPNFDHSVHSENMAQPHTPPGPRSPGSVKSWDILEDSRLSEKWHFGAVDTVIFSPERESLA